MFDRPVLRSSSLALAALALVLPAGAQAAPLNRPDDPVVLTGGGSLNGVAPGDVVAFAWSGSWRQVPVQVDERAPVDLGRVYGGPPNGVVVTEYTDPGTFTGPGPNSALDADDEVALMARDSGDRAPAGGPGAVDPRTRLDVEVTDPLAPGRTGWFSLFRRTSGLDPGAGRRLVGYSFGLASGAYKSSYRLTDGPNPENSSVTSPFYRRHFSDRWLSDGIRVDAGAASGADILDRHKPQFGPGICGRTEDTFDDAEGAFVVNKSGPVRALRSYVGANSGPLTQREHVFYERREDIRTDLRVHAIPGVMDYFDYSPAAAGMTYRSSAAPGGVPIDGVPDSPASGALAWESVDGPQGGLSISHAASTDISPFTQTSYYLDDSTTPGSGPDHQCSGDNTAYGASGPWITSALPNTDPRLGAAKHLRSTRHIYYEAPGQAARFAPARAGQAAAPLRVRTLAPPTGLSLTASPGTILFGRSSLLAGRLAGPFGDGQALRVFRDGAVVGSTSTGGGGAFALRARPSRNARYTVGGAGVTSPSALVRVMPRVVLRAGRRRHGRVRFAGRVCPAHRGRRVSIQRLTGGRWRRVARARLARGRRCSGFTRRVRLRRGGRFRAVLGAHPGHATGVSPGRRVR